MKKIYFTLLLLLLCTVSVFSSQLYTHTFTSKQMRSITPPQKDSTSIISGIISLPSIR